MMDRAKWAEWDAAQESGLKLLKEAAPSSAWPDSVCLPIHWWKHVVAFAVAVESAGYGIDVIQLKEKCGGLRLYWGWNYSKPKQSDEPGTLMVEEVKRLVRAAEAKCECTCVDCGGPGASYGPFNAVLCTACGVTRELDRASRVADLCGE